jgi:hypothetical protein
VLRTTRLRPAVLVRQTNRHVSHEQRILPNRPTRYPAHPRQLRPSHHVHVARNVCHEQRIVPNRPTRYPAHPRQLRPSHHVHVARNVCHEQRIVPNRPTRYPAHRRQLRPSHHVHVARNVCHNQRSPLMQTTNRRVITKFLIPTPAKSSSSLVRKNTGTDRQLLCVTGAKRLTKTFQNIGGHTERVKRQSCSRRTYHKELVSRTRLKSGRT